MKGGLYYRSSSFSLWPDLSGDDQIWAFQRLNVYCIVAALCWPAACTSSTAVTHFVLPPGVVLPQPDQNRGRNRRNQREQQPQPPQQLNKGTTITGDRIETSPGTERDVEETANNSILALTHILFFPSLYLTLPNEFMFTFD